MSELINAEHHDNTRWHLLATVSMAALLPLICGVQEATARDENQPTVWIELGGQLERVDGQGSVFPAPFMKTYADSPAFSPVSPVEAQKAPRYSKGFEGKITLAPHGSDWSLSASLLYGRSNGDRRVHQQTAGIPVPPSMLIHGYPGLDPINTRKVSDIRSKDAESHMLLDFKVGKDVGLGLLGSGSTSTLSLGVRFAQFSSDKNVQFKARPDLHFLGSVPLKYWTNFVGAGQSARSFHGVGPTVSWEGSKTLVGGEDSAIALDWGAAGALLFGRQKAGVSHNTTASRFHELPTYYVMLYKHTPPARLRSHSVAVPDIGGFAGISFRASNAKVNLGYRGEMLFGAVDGGIDTRKTQNLSFHGPFATISIGLGG